MISDEDKALFRAHMRAVKPLKPTDKIDSSKPQKTTEIKKNPISPQKNIKATPYLSDYISEEVHSDTLLSWRCQSLPQQRFRELNKGQIRWETRLDLHGLKPDDARVKLSDFIARENSMGTRCMLIIHGKGSLRGEPPILKNLINRWLPQFQEVLAFCSALPKDGGAGAVYVLLKRLR